MVNSTDFAKRLQKILDYYSLSATAFSEQIDFNRSTISHLLSGRNKPSLEFVMKVLEEFPEVELYWLMNGKGSFPSEGNETEKTTPKKIVSEASSNSQANLFPDEKISKEKITKEIVQNTNPSAIERIVIFFKDGSFKSYE
ncbi:MAG: transcriptional regulator [Alteromonas sp.]|nr:transcriptional regulator [Alteromonas sp.]MAY22159.1 transcriptional regulator [Flavobacteriaceae bacterium]|tara:strand:- start:42449 stop:42871 length:423 start_codon:yes stop_codon:yes gene_type:complete